MKQSLVRMLVALMAWSLVAAGASPLRVALALPALQDAAGEIIVEDNAAVSVFGAEVRELRFALRARSDDPIRSVQLLYRVDDSPVQITVEPHVQRGRVTLASYIWRVAGVLPPGTQVHYQWQIETQGGSKHATPARTVRYDDTRFSWREATADQVSVYWYTPESQTGASLLEEASKTVTRVRTEYGLTLDKPLRIYAYAREGDYVSAVATGAAQIDAAMTLGTDRVFLLAPGATSNMTPVMRALRRELAGAIFLQKTDNPYGPPPRWLREGFSFFAGGESLPDESVAALRQYAQSNRLLPLRTLNSTFPSTDREQSLAYVESVSVVRFMYDAYGPERMRALLASFKEGNTVDDALKTSLGVTLDQLETRWKNALKSGRMPRPGDSPAPATGVAFVDDLIGPPMEYWRGVLGPSAPIIIIGAGVFVLIGVLAVIGGTVYSVVRVIRAANEE